MGQRRRLASGSFTIMESGSVLDISAFKVRYAERATGDVQMKRRFEVVPLRFRSASRKTLKSANNVVLAVYGF